MTKFKCFHDQCGKASETSQKKHKIYETKMIRLNGESIDARNQRSSCCERDRQARQEIFYQFRKDHEKIATDNIKMLKKKKSKHSSDCCLHFERFQARLQQDLF